MFELATRFADPFVYEAGASREDKLKKTQLLFHELTQVALWANCTDLSLLINMTEEDIQRLQSTGGEHLASTEKNILGSDLPQLWQRMSGVRNGSISIVLDNAGFELYCDFIYADWLIQSGIASEIRFHGKRIPWFVSDVTTADFNWLINSMCYGSLFPDASESELAALRQLGVRWQGYVKENKWIYEQVRSGSDQCDLACS